MADRNIVVDTSPSEQQREPATSSSLASWVMTRVSDWEDHRQTNFDKKWDEYYRLWRGIWANEDKVNKTERSKIINPALAQAIESAVAELEEGTFGRGKWFDVEDDVNDPNTADIQMWRDQLAEDFTKEDVESAFSETYLNGALYGTGIGKIILQERTDRKINPEPIGSTQIVKAAVTEEEVIRVGLKAVHPKEFVIDPAAKCIEDALGMAHITDVPKHKVKEKQAKGIYKDVQITSYTDNLVGSKTGQDAKERSNLQEEDQVQITEYHGFVPKYLLDSVEDETDGADNAEIIEDDDQPDETLIESIVTIANGGTLLRAVENPYIMGDRCFIAYQHDTVPNRFWGRGVSEKGYNPQKALDAEGRGRIDAMALSIRPMMAMDATRLQRGFDFEVSPGRNVFTNGDPKEVLMPFNFGQVNPSTFSQTADLERQVQMGTGSMDSAVSTADNQRNQTSGGMSMIQGGAIKRSKRTLANIERQFTRPFIHKAAWRYMQFAPDRYPVQDISFKANGTLGIMARELEQQQLANMMKTVPAESPAFWMLLKGIFDHSNLEDREQLLLIIDAMMKQSLQKQMNPEPDPLIQIKMREMEIDKELEEAKILQKGDKDNKDLMVQVEKLKIERENLRLKEQDMILDARVALAGQEQDSIVTAVQMDQKNTKDRIDLILKLQQQAMKQPAQVVQAGEDEKKKRKKVSVQRTSEGLKGVVESFDAPRSISVTRTADGRLEGIVD